MLLLTLSERDFAMHWRFLFCDGDANFIHTEACNFGAQGILTTDFEAVRIDKYASADLKVGPSLPW